MPVYKRHHIISSSVSCNRKHKNHDYITENIQKVHKAKDIEEIDRRCKYLVGMNIPKIQLGCSFSRRQLFDIYSNFKALAKISKTNFPD